jgi:large subunit ribosomal protein L15
MFRSEVFAINLCRLEEMFNDGDVVNLKVLQQMGVAPRRALGGLKILSQGEISKKIVIEATAFSEAAQEKLKSAGIKFTVVGSENA